MTETHGGLLEKRINVLMDTGTVFAERPSVWRYDILDPYAITTDFIGMYDAATDHTLTPATWTFGRELIINGLGKPYESGDMAVEPYRRYYLRIGLFSPNGAVELLAPRKKLERFILETLEVVPLGEESDFQEPELERAVLELEKLSSG